MEYKILPMGTQIAYVPGHVNGNLNHSDVEFGFVIAPTSEPGYFCRYWTKGKEGSTLRTKSTSENTPIYGLMEHESCSQLFVNNQLELLGYK